MGIKKVHLRDVCMYPRNIHDVYQKSDDVLIFSVENYSRLEKNKIYYRCSRSHDRRWTMKIVISQNILFVFLSTLPLCKKVLFCILREGKETEQPELTMNEVLAHHVFVSEFCNKAILDPKNNYLRDDKLIIQCKYKKTEREVVSYDTYYSEMPCENDMFKVSKNMLDLYRTGLYSDFSIKVADITFWVHKMLLAARSKYFADLFTSNRTINSETLAGIPNAMNEVLIYIYSGEMRVISESDMVEVLKFSNTLQIDCLKRKCLNFFKNHFSPYTVMGIVKLAEIHNLKDLKEAVTKYIMENMEFILRTTDEALSK